MSPPKLPRIPTFSKRALQRIIRDLPAKLEAAEKDREDQRCLRGKHAPEHGQCRVCPGHVIAEVSFPHTDMIGGPPMQAYVNGWHCDECGLVYHFRPPPRDP